MQGDAELQTVNMELSTLNAVIPTLPEGNYKEDNLAKQKKLDWRKQVLNNKRADYGTVALLDKEFELASVERRLLEVDAFIAALTARKAAL